MPLEALNVTQTGVDDGGGTRSNLFESVKEKEKSISTLSGITFHLFNIHG